MKVPPRLLSARTQPASPTRDSLISVAGLDRLPIPLARAAFTQRATVAHDLAVIVNALTALIADDAVTLEARHLLWANGHAHPLRIEQLVIRHFPICEHLLLIFTCDLRVHLFRQRLRRFLRRDPHGAIIRQVNERRSHLALVTELQRPFAQPAPGHDPD